MFHLEMLAPLEISINYNDIAKSVLKFYKLNSSFRKAAGRLHQFPPGDNSNHRKTPESSVLVRFLST